MITINGRSSLDFGVGIHGNDVYNAPKRSTESISVPGRNGDLIIDNGRYENISVTYHCYIISDFGNNIDNFRAFLMANPGYCRIEDTFHPEEYRIGRVSKELDVDVKGKSRAGEFDLTFDMKPQRYLKAGEEWISPDSVIYNPTLFNAKPLIKTGKGTITIGDYTITVANDCPVNEIYLDCDLMNAYNGSTNLNNYVSGTFPELIPGANAITGNFEIQPRWWTI
jgi:phage-related protein